MPAEQRNALSFQQQMRRQAEGAYTGRSPVKAFAEARSPAGASRAFLLFVVLMYQSSQASCTES